MSIYAEKTIGSREGGYISADLEFWRVSGKVWWENVFGCISWNNFLPGEKSCANFISPYKKMCWPPATSIRLLLIMIFCKSVKWTNLNLFVALSTVVRSQSPSYRWMRKSIWSTYSMHQISINYRFWCGNGFQTQRRNFLEQHSLCGRLYVSRNIAEYKKEKNPVLFCPFPSYFALGRSKFKVEWNMTLHTHINSTCPFSSIFLMACCTTDGLCQIHLNERETIKFSSVYFQMMCFR